MRIDESLIQEAIREAGAQGESLLNGSKTTISRPDGTQYRPYARILIQPSVLEIARRYAHSFFEQQGCIDGYDKILDELVQKINSELSEESKAFLSSLIMSAFLEGGIFCACGGGIGRREEFVKLAVKAGMVNIKPTTATEQLELDF